MEASAKNRQEERAARTASTLGTADARDEAEPAGQDQDTAALLSRFALIGLFLIALLAALSVARPFVLPVLAALIVGVTIGGPVDRLKRTGFPPWIIAIVTVALVLSAVLIGAMLLVTPISDWVSRAPDVTAKVKERLAVLERPLLALQELSSTLSGGGGGGSPTVIDLGKGNIAQGVLMFLTPALSGFVLFFGTLLFFLVGRTRIKGQLVLSFVERSHRLTMLRIISDMESDLATYLTTTTLINLGVGLCTAGVMYALGVPNAPLWGWLAFFLNYLPYIGPAMMAAILFIVGLVAFSTLSQSLLPPACFLCVAAIEGQVVSPTLLGKRLELNPLAVFIGMAFWTWLWGPVGAFLSVPMLVIAMVVWRNLFPPDIVNLP